MSYHHQTLSCCPVAPRAYTLRMGPRSGVARPQAMAVLSHYSVNVSPHCAWRAQASLPGPWAARLPSWRAQEGWPWGSPALSLSLHPPEGSPRRPAQAKACQLAAGGAAARLPGARVPGGALLPGGGPGDLPEQRARGEPQRRRGEWAGRAPAGRAARLGALRRPPSGRAPWGHPCPLPRAPLKPCSCAWALSQRLAPPPWQERPVWV